MSKRTVFTTVTPLPAGVTRQIVLDFLHDHEEMIDLNPLVKERHPISTPPHAMADEQDCQWFSLTDKISYLPGVAGDVTYTCAFHDLADGLQTHCYAPAGLTIRDKWTVGGSLPGEPAQRPELGLKAPATGLYLREDVDMRCNVIMTGFVKKTLKRSHAALVDRLKIKAQIAGSRSNRSSGGTGQPPRHLPAAALPTGHPSSNTSSVASTSSSPSCYSVQSSPLWSPRTGSITVSPALSALSSPPTSNLEPYQTEAPQGDQQFMYVSAKQFDTAPRPNTIPWSRPEPVTTVPAATRASAREPDTPFLRQHQPDWPRTTQPAAAATAATAAAAAAAAAVAQSYPPHMPSGGPSPPASYYPTNRTDASLWIEPYSSVRGEVSHEKPAAADRGADSKTDTGDAALLPDDALWQALGGGRFSAGDARRAPRRLGVGSSGGGGVAHGQEHPDYPHMSPYDNDGEEEDGKDASARGFGAVRLRPVSQPPPLRRVGPVLGLGLSAPAPALRGSFVAGLD